MACARNLLVAVSKYVPEINPELNMRVESLNPISVQTAVISGSRLGGRRAPPLISTTGSDVLLSMLSYSRQQLPKTNDLRGKIGFNRPIFSEPLIAVENLIIEVRHKTKIKIFADMFS
mmetsp:Transcript_20863/g.30886  ORF Transcript_20863/g.30886 Transcript_20863/m.30886 type:complete len:118 (+) Transcript_20863:126-479(+)